MVRNLFKLLRHNKRGRKEGESDISRAYVWILFFGSQCERHSASKKKEKLEQMKEKGEPKKKFPRYKRAGARLNQSIASSGLRSPRFNRIPQREIQMERRRR